jgi:hypothetical protein
VSQYNFIDDEHRYYLRCTPATSTHIAIVATPHIQLLRLQLGHANPSPEIAVPLHMESSVVPAAYAELENEQTLIYGAPKRKQLTGHKLSLLLNFPMPVYVLPLGQPERCVHYDL